MVSFEVRTETEGKGKKKKELYYLHIIGNAIGEMNGVDVPFSGSVKILLRHDNLDSARHATRHIFNKIVCSASEHLQLL